MNKINSQNDSKFNKLQITPDNFKQIFDKWTSLIGREIFGITESDYASIFFMDILSDDDIPVFFIEWKYLRVR